MRDLFDELIFEINHCLNDGYYLAALSLALTLPDICGKAEFPDATPTERYIKWFNLCFSETEINNYNKDMPYLDGELLYNLRNNLFHQGSPSLDVKKIKNPNNKLDSYSLLLEDENELGIYGDHAKVSYSDLDMKNPKSREMENSLRRICKILGSVAEGYYKENIDKFSFLSSDIKDRRKINE